MEFWPFWCDRFNELKTANCVYSDNYFAVDTNIKEK